MGVDGVDGLHPVQDEMRRLETAFDEQGHPPLDACIAQLTGFEGDVDGDLDPVLQAETARAVALAKRFYAPALGAEPSAGHFAAVGFLQGVTFAAAVRSLKDPDVGFSDETKDVL